MKTAFTIWKDRIAPLFDVARQIHLVEWNDGGILSETRISLVEGLPALKIHQLAEMGVNTLVCGAISRPLQSMMTAYDIELVPFINGDVKAVIAAWDNGRLTGEAFRMPGCRRRGAQRLQMNPRNWQGEAIMNGNTARGRGQGRRGKGHRGQMAGGQGVGRRNAGGGTGPGVADEVCVCPQCGHEERHQRGVPCMDKVCAKCGGTMTRK